MTTETTTRRMTSLGTFRTRKAADTKIAEMAAQYPGRTYELRVEVGGRFYIVCTNADR